jgi:hypothetical protein
LAVFAGSRTCPECGWELRPKGRIVHTLDGELVEIGAGLPEDEIDRRQFFAELRGYCVEKGWKPGAAAWKFKEKFGHFPPRDWSHWSPLEPSLETRRWIKSRNIAWAKSRARAS